MPSLLARGTRGATTLRVVEYNVDSSDIGNNSNLADVTTVLQGIGLHQMAGNAQMPDVIGLTELLLLLPGVALDPG